MVGDVRESVGLGVQVEMDVGRMPMTVRGPGQVREPLAQEGA